MAGHNAGPHGGCIKGVWELPVDDQLLHIVAIQVPAKRGPVFPPVRRGKNPEEPAVQEHALRIFRVNGNITRLKISVRPGQPPVPRLPRGPPVRGKEDPLHGCRVYLLRIFRGIDDRKDRAGDHRFGDPPPRLPDGIPFVDRPRLSLLIPQSECVLPVPIRSAGPGNQRFPVRIEHQRGNALVSQARAHAGPRITEILALPDAVILGCKIDRPILEGVNPPDPDPSGGWNLLPRPVDVLGVGIDGCEVDPVQPFFRRLVPVRVACGV